MGILQERKPAVACTTARRRVLLLCSPCMGHLIPFVELARRLVSDHGLAATLLFASATSQPSEQYLAVAAAAVRDGIDLAADGGAPLAALVVNMIGVAARGVAAELGVPLYLFFTSPWMALLLLLRLPDPEIDASAERGGDGGGGEHRDAAEPIRLPGCVPIHAHELPASMLADRSSDMYAGFLAMAKAIQRVDGILVNTSGEIEPAVGGGMDGLEELPPVHPVGPLVWTRPVVGVDREHECVRWLDQQPRGSVVYVSFGSGGTLTLQQTAELALGLELSQCRFVWAVKRPHQSLANGTFFGTQKGEDVLLDFLPEGFMERTRGAGFVTQSWAPQTAILEHPSVGCFVTHCGWNSILESVVVNGVPMIAWPLYAEQHMNATMLEVQVGVAVRAKVAVDRFTSREEVATAIQRVTVGEEADERMRKRASELKDKLVHALSKDGSSAHALAKIANVWKHANKDK
ncbi:unnamed protein product [Urochloa decumbens]|uniref:Glycosyltransferase n=1 Tax=Urochloa decumbens TaxID=240449 RepID=A0ABC8W9Q9_9POAL